MKVGRLAPKSTSCSTLCEDDFLGEGLFFNLKSSIYAESYKCSHQTSALSKTEKMTNCTEKLSIEPNFLIFYANKHSRFVS